jgi:uncharacterized protein YjiK
MNKRKLSQFNSRTGKGFGFASAVVMLGLVLGLFFAGVPASSAQGTPPVIWQVQALVNEQTGLSNPVGVAFSPRANAFEVLEGQGPADATDLVKLTPFADRAGQAQIAAAVQDPINVAYDNLVGRLLLVGAAGNQLLEVHEDAAGNIDPQTLIRHNISSWGLQDPQGMTVDANGILYILDAGGTRLVRVEPGAGGDLEAATVSQINLSLASARGIAFDPTTGSLQVMVPAEQRLYELSPAGDVLAVRDISPLGLQNTQGMVFAPSGDQTDDPAQTSLFVAESADPTLQSTGQIVELSLVTPAALPSGTTLLPASLVQTFATSGWNKPSPDPGGIDYFPAIGGFLITDSEVEESVNSNPPAYWKGYNVFLSSLSGSLVGNCTTYTSGTVSLAYNNFSTEPTGVAINNNNNHIFFTQDGSHGKLFELNPGGDGAYCTPDDIVTSRAVATLYGATDAEDVAYGNNTAFLSDGVNAEVWVFPLGPDGVMSSDDGAVTHWDTAALGFHDLEGIGFNQDNGTLFIVSTQGSENYLGEVSTSGQLLRAYSLSFMGTQGNIRSDVAYAPASQNQAAKSLYIASRGVDNNTSRLENDGKVWEINISSSQPPPTTPPPTTDLIFADGFESGNLSAWTASAVDAGDLSVTGAATLVGSKGLQAVIDDTNAIHVTDDTPNAEPRYRARFYFDPNSISMASGDNHYLFFGYAGTSTGVVRGQFRFSSGQYQIRFSLINDSGTWLNTIWFPISDAPHSFEFDWRAASAAGANDGYLTLWIDGAQTANITGVDNDTRRIDRARLGPRSGLDTGTRGTYYFDAFESRRQTYIGP